MLRDLLQEPRTKGINVDSVDRVRRHREILLQKKMIRDVFFELYDLLARKEREFFGQEPGPRIEIGAGSSLLKMALPDIEVTDIVPFEGLDRVVDAQNMPYESGSIKSVFGIHCFHHLPDPYRFLEEVQRVCRPGGGAVLIDPYYGPLASFFFKRLFATEKFDPSGPAVMPAGGPMSDANQALSYIVFVRDKDVLRERFPDLEVVAMEPVPNYVRYLLSGGVNFRQLLPDRLSPALRALESLLAPLKSTLALHHLIVIRKAHARA